MGRSGTPWRWRNPSAPRRGLPWRERAFWWRWIGAAPAVPIPGHSALPWALPLSRSGAAVRSAADDGIIKSPMSGKVLAIRVKPGDKVASGDEVSVVEAMKMEQSIRAPRAGTVKKVHVKPLQQVNIHACETPRRARLTLPP